MKRIISLLLAAVLMLSCFPVTASAATSGTCGENVTWSLDESTGTLTIFGSGDMADYSWEGTPPWNENASSIKTIVISNNVTSIGNLAFNCCNSLTSITIPESVTRIGDCAFWACESLPEISLPSSVTSIGDSAFYYCISLINITIPDSVTTIGAYVFDTCYNLTSVDIGNSVTSIADYAFNNCSALTSITIPNSVTYIGDWAFCGCSNLANVTIGDSVTSIGHAAFHSCNNLTNFYIPRSVTSIGDSAFLYCEKMEEILVDNANNSYVSINGVLYTKDQSTLVCCSGNYRFTDGNYVIAHGVTSIGNSAFRLNKNLTSITLPDSVKDIHDFAFEECTSLTSITIPASITSISWRAFNDCTSLTDVYYAGTEEQRNMISIDTMNDPLESATWHCVEGDAPSVTKLGTPSNLQWDENVAGLAWWTIEEPIENDYTLYCITLYRDGTEVTSTSYLEYTPESPSHFEEYGYDRANGFWDVIDTSGTYYFTVQAKSLFGENIDSDIAKSETWTYVKPDSEYSKPESLVWNWPTVTWSSDDSNAQYKIEFYYAATANTEPTLLASYSNDCELYNDYIEMQGEGYYYFRVRTLSDNITEKCHSNWSELSDAYYYDGGKSLTPPSVKVSVNTSTGKNKLSWNKVAGANLYRVYRATSKTGSYSRVKSTSSTSYTDTSAKAGTNYYYKVLAVNSDTGKTSEYSAVVNRMCDLPKPAVKMSVNTSTGKPKLSWGKISGAAKYRVYRATSEGGTYKLVKTTTSTSYTDTDAKVGKEYFYKVVAVHSKSSANSAYSDIVSRVCDLKKPTVSIKLNSGDPKVTWKKVSGATKYRVYRATSKNGTYKLIKTTTKTGYTDTSAKAGKTYYYKVKAVHSNSAANSAYSSVKSIKAK